MRSQGRVLMVIAPQSRDIFSIKDGIDLRIRSAGNSGTIFPGHNGTCSTVPRCTSLPCQWLQKNRIKPICSRN